MKRLILMSFIVLCMTVFLGGNIGFAQDTPKTGCAKQACFKSMDTDKDGQISESEFIESRKKCFAAMDTDKNGSLSKDEFKKCCMKAMPEKSKGCPYMKNKNKQ